MQRKIIMKMAYTVKDICIKIVIRKIMYYNKKSGNLRNGPWKVIESVKN